MYEEITRTRVGVTTYLAPPGPLHEERGIAVVKEVIQACVRDQQVQVLIDLANVALISGLALEVLLDGRDQLAKLGGRLQVANPSPLLADIFRATGFDNFVTLVDLVTARAIPGRQSEPGTARRKLGDILLERGLLKAEQVAEATRLQKQSGKRLGRIFVERSWVSEIDLLKALSEQLGVPYVTLRPGLYDPAAAELVDIALARRLEILPMFRVKDTLTVATTDPLSVLDLDQIELATGCRLRLVLAQREQILKYLFEAYNGGEVLPEFATEAVDDLALVDGRQRDDYVTIDEMAGSSPVVNLINSILQRAIRDSVSDIHLEPGPVRGRVRFRIDGVLYEAMTPPLDTHPALVSRLKVMANLDIAERRMPQDGRIQVVTQGRTVDLRFSSLPGIFGEKVVLRVLDKNQSMLDIEKLGMHADILSTFRTLLGRSHGLILVTGPTGSGKNTTLYAAVNHLRGMERNIVTIEDPVEYQLDLVNQNQVNDAIGLTFARLLRHALRQDPDIIMVGEIRDRQTAEIAVQAALTGHLVLSTLHTNDAIGATSRLVEMGVEPYLLSSALIGVVAQRLVRHICPACQTSYLVEPEVLNAFGRSETAPVRLSRGRGCPACYDSGYRGRVPIHEILEVDAEVQRLMMVNTPRDEYVAHMQRRNARSLRDDGVQRAIEGVTTLDEIARAIHG